MPQIHRLAAFVVPATLLIAVAVVDAQIQKRPLAPAAGVVPQGQLQSVRDSFERVPLIMGKIDGSQNPDATDRSSLRLSCRATVTFCLPDQLAISPNHEVVFALSGTNRTEPYRPVKPAGNFPPPNLSEFELGNSPVARTRLSVRFDRKNCAYSLHMTGLGATTGNSTQLKRVMAMDDIVFTVTVFDDAKKKAYIGRIPVRVVESNDRD